MPFRMRPIFPRSLHRLSANLRWRPVDGSQGRSNRLTYKESGELIKSRCEGIRYCCNISIDLVTL